MALSCQKVSQKVVATFLAGSLEAQYWGRDRTTAPSTISGPPGTEAVRWARWAWDRKLVALPRKYRKILTFLASITHLQSEYHSLEPCPLLKKKLMLSESSSLRWECLPITPVSSLSFPVVAGTHRRWQSVIYIRRLYRNWYTSYDLTVLGHGSIPADDILVS